MTPELLKAYALSFIGAPYRFGAAFGGGDDPLLGFDCSGLVCELLRASGVVPWNFRTNAQGLLSLPNASGVSGIRQFADLVFFGQNINKVSHVGFCLDRLTMLEAGGGDSSTVTVDLASERNAFVRLRPVSIRSDYLGAIRPPYPFVGA
jgi:cell wall-associated NlpC family hydrolase